MLSRLSFLLVIASLSASTATAATSYLEFGVGTGIMAGSNPLFGATAPPFTRFGLAHNLTLAYGFGKRTNAIQFHIGLSERYISGNDKASISMVALYPLLRFETPRFFVGGGLTPLVLGRLATTDGFDGFEPKSGAIAALAEVGVLWRIVPFFHLILGGAGQMVKSSGGIGPKPALDVTLIFRFQLHTTDQQRESKEYDGWRYPFGIEIWKD